MSRAACITVTNPVKFINQFSKEITMSIYMSRFAYNGASYKAMMDNPSDREAAAKAGFAAVGGKILHVYYSASTGELVCIGEGDATQVSAGRMITMAAGATSVSVEELITPSDMTSAMKLAGKVASQYRAPNQ